MDGDGAVSAQDCALAKKFDVNNDGKLDESERHQLRKTMVAALVNNYKNVPKVRHERQALPSVQATLNSRLQPEYSSLLTVIFRLVWVSPF